MSERLPPKLEAAALMRRATSEGGFATLLKRGDPDRGVISLLVAERGQPVAVLERQMAADFAYRWAEVPSGTALEAGWKEFVEKKRRFDPDIWLIELDVADAQRFIAETIVTG